MFLRNEKRRDKREQESYSRARETRESPFAEFPVRYNQRPTIHTNVVQRSVRVARRDLADPGEIAHVIYELRKHADHPLYERIYARCTAGFNPDTLRLVERMQDIVEKETA